MSSAPAFPITLDAFEQCIIPLEAFNHRAHLTVAYLLLREHSLDDATDRMRRGVKKFNATHGVETTLTQGYHETLTLAWMRILHTTMQAYGPADTADEFFAQHPHLLSKVMLRLFYTRERIMSAEARAGFVEPDLATLPQAASIITAPGR
jgi:hypothetical protein